MSLWKKLFVIVAFVALLGGCNAPAEQAPPTGAPPAQVTPPPAATDLPPTPTLSLPTPTPTLPPPVVVDVATPVPTAPPAPTAEPTPAAPAEILLLRAEDFIPAGRNPLTGELVDDPTVLQRRPILCKISDSPPEWVRPQSGLNYADIIFEHLTEGAITRYSALFYGRTPESVGPIRSARLIDLELPLMYDASLCFSGGSSGQGANRGVWQLVYDQQFAPRVLRSEYPGYYRTGEDKPYEHTFYNRLPEAWAKLAEIGQNQPPNYVTPIAFSNVTPANSAPAGVVRLQYGRGVQIEWRYNPALGEYQRWLDGDVIVDKLDGEQVSVSNVIVIKAPHYINRNICEYQSATQCEAFSTEIQIWGKGFASIFRDGRQINGEWRREDRRANGMPFTFYDEAGNPLPLQIGQSWVQVLPYDEYYIQPVLEVTP